MRKIILENGIDSVIHLAASLSVGVGEKFPKRYYKNNVIATQSLIDSCKHTNVKNFIFSSTAAVYKDGLQKVSEKSPIKPVSVYGKTKLKAENLIIKNCKKYKINYGVLRYFNVVGSSPTGKIGLINNGDHLFKNFSKEILKKKPKFKIYGKDYNTPDKTTIRDYVHVSDLAEIHIKVLNTIKLIKKSIILNCGYGKGVSVLQTANEFKRQSKKKVKIQIQNRRAGDMKIIVATNKKLIKLTKWKSKYNNLNFLVKSSIAWERKLLRK